MPTNYAIYSARQLGSFIKANHQQCNRRCQSTTIFALSTGYIKSAIAVFRVSGPEAGSVIAKVGGVCSPEHHRIYVRSFRHPATSKLIDRGLLLWFKGPSSFTGEDVCELQCHGSIAIIKAMTNALSSIDGLRLAEPGEFAKRAFFNRKIDLADAEGLADLIEAETEAQLEQALKGGQLSRVCNSWMFQLKEAMANLEAYIDFSEDQNISPDEVVSAVSSILQKIRQEMQFALQSAPTGQAIREGFKVAVSGRPNVGKSSLVNILSQQETSIVSPLAGTTRDLVKVTIDLQGLPVVLCDTAGNRFDAEDPIELEGIYRARKFLKNAHLNILVTDDIYRIADDAATIAHGDTITVLNKSDLICQLPPDLSVDFAVSCKTGKGITELVEGIATRLRAKHSLETPSLIIRERQQALIQNALSNIDSCLSEDFRYDAAISAEYLRRAGMDLGRITGRVETEDILNIIFSQFCIGK